MVVQLGRPPAAVTLMGAIVDAVEEVVQLGEADLEPTPDFGGSPDTDYILGMATIHGGVKTLLDLDKIFLEEGLFSSLGAETETSTQPNNVTMNSWTISRRIIFGFVTMVLITVALGFFALWRLESLAQPRFSGG